MNKERAHSENELHAKFDCKYDKEDLVCNLERLVH